MGGGSAGGSSSIGGQVPKGGDNTSGASVILETSWRTAQVFLATCVLKRNIFWRPGFEKSLYLHERLRMHSYINTDTFRKALNTCVTKMSQLRVVVVVLPMLKLTVWHSDPEVSKTTKKQS